RERCEVLRVHMQSDGTFHMAQTKQSSKKRKRSKTALHLWATAGVSLAVAGSASANTPAAEAPSQDTGTRVVLAEAEVSDVNLGTFYVFDRERGFSPDLKVAAGRGGCGGGGCGGRGCGGGGGCAAHPSGCVGGGGCAAHP